MLNNMKLAVIASVLAALPAVSANGCLAAVSLGGAAECSANLIATLTPAHATITKTKTKVIDETVFATATVSTGKTATTTSTTSTTEVVKTKSKTSTITDEVYVTTSATLDVTATVTDTLREAKTVTHSVAAKNKRGLISACPAITAPYLTVPNYAAVCTNAAAYSSACNVLGVEATTTTASQCTVTSGTHVTSTDTVTETVSTTVANTKATSTAVVLQTTISTTTAWFDVSVSETSFVTSFQTMTAANKTLTKTDYTSTTTLSETCKASPTSFTLILSTAGANAASGSWLRLGTSGAIASGSEIYTQSDDVTSFEYPTFTLNSLDELVNGKLIASQLVADVSGGVLYFSKQASINEGLSSAMSCSIGCELHLSCSDQGNTVWSYCPIDATTNGAGHGLYLGTSVPSGCKAAYVKALSA